MNREQIRDVIVENIGPAVNYNDAGRAADALLAVFEKAHAPTDDERAKAIRGMDHWAQYADNPATRVDCAHVRDWLRRYEVPEPQGEPSDAPKRLVYEVNMILSSVASHGPAALTDTSDRMYTTGLLRRLRDALDPKPAHRLAAGNAVRAEMARNGLDVHRMVYGQEIANVLAGAALDAALRAAGGVR